MSERTEPTIPTRRTSAGSHLQRAAKSGLGSDEERYSTNAAIAEALIDINATLVELCSIVRRGVP